MPYTEPARMAPGPLRIRWPRVAGLLVVLAALAAALIHQPSSSAPSASTARAPALLPETTDPSVANLKPALRAAVRRAAAQARRDGVGLTINSGWRSAADEDRLRREAVAKYGSEAEAARWVATGATSLHVSGDAVDIGPPAAAQWLGEHGAAYGLCRVYANEPWHFELRAGAATRGCPALYTDPTHDPRMHR